MSDPLTDRGGLTLRELDARQVSELRAVGDKLRAGLAEMGIETVLDLLEHYPRRDAPGAHFRPFAYLHGRAVATWGLRQGVAEIDMPFVSLEHPDERTLAAEAADVARFLSG